MSLAFLLPTEIELYAATIPEFGMCTTLSSCHPCSSQSADSLKFTLLLLDLIFPMGRSGYDAREWRW